MLKQFTDFCKDLELYKLRTGEMVQRESAYCVRVVSEGLFQRTNPGDGHLQYQHWGICCRSILSAHLLESLDTMRIFIVSEKSYLKEIQVGKMLRKPYPYQPMTYIGNYVSK